MAFREAIFTKALNLAETTLGKVLLIAIGHHAIDQAFAKFMDDADLTKGCHGTAQTVGLRGRKSCGNNGDAHGLFLKQGHTKGLAKHIFQRLRGKGDLLLALTTAQIGMDHIALNWPRAHNGDFNNQIIKGTRAQPGQHRHLRPAFNLKHANRVRRTNHIINSRVFGGNIGKAEPDAIIML